MGGRAGKSIVSLSPSLSTTSGPLRVENTTRFRSGVSSVIKTNALAKVACPHRSTSVVGVNQRNANPSASGTKKAVSDRLFSAAIFCISGAGSHAPSGQTAAGFPPNGWFVKASTW